jgi:hypothetical protein
MLVRDKMAIYNKDQINHSVLFKEEVEISIEEEENAQATTYDNGLDCLYGPPSI